MNFEIGDKLEVNPVHTYFYKMNTTFTYMGRKAGQDTHSIKADNSGEVFSMLITRTLKKWFKVVEINSENE